MTSKSWNDFPREFRYRVSWSQKKKRGREERTRKETRLNLPSRLLFNITFPIPSFTFQKSSYDADWSARWKRKWHRRFLLSQEEIIGVGYKVIPSEEVLLISFLLEISTMVRSLWRRLIVTGWQPMFRIKPNSCLIPRVMVHLVVRAQVKWSESASKLRTFAFFARA